LPRFAWGILAGDVAGERRIADTIAAFNRGDLDAGSDYWTDDLDYRAAQGAPDDPGPIHGKEAMRTYVEDWLDTFDDFRGEVIELIDAGDDVIVVMRIGGRAKLSGVETDLTFAAIYTIETGRSLAAVSIGRESKPSKPPGCGNRTWGTEAWPLTPGVRVDTPGK
jgi:ketosteroid isomerase-like protein